MTTALKTQLNVLEEALHYAGQGFPVFPLYGIFNGKCTCKEGAKCTSPGKHPRTSKGLMNASTNITEVQRLFEGLSPEQTNIGIRTGKKFNFAAVDVDLDKGANLDDLINLGTREILNATPCVKTGGGLHFYFQFPEEFDLRNSASALLPNVDVRAEGGYIVAPPSMHISGNKYHFLNTGDLQPFPKSFLQKLSASKVVTNKSTSVKAVAPSGVIQNGSRNSSLTSEAGKLRRLGLSENVILAAITAINTEKCSPPLEHKELARIAKSVGRYAVETAVSETLNVEEYSLLTVMSGNDWQDQGQTQSVPGSICDSFILEGQVAIFFGDTGANKSVFAVQMGNAAAAGIPIPGLGMTAKPQKVLYVDCELGTKQFERRYSNEFTDHFRFHPNFFRAAISKDVKLPDGIPFESFLMKTIEAEIVKREITFLIVDNITFLRSQTETAKDALPLMKALLELKRRYPLTLKCLAHTPKRDKARPLLLSDLQGSSHLSIFADAVYGINKSTGGKSIRYIKQFKQRDDMEVYTEEQVAVFELRKDNNFLGLHFKGCEDEHFHVASNDNRTTAMDEAKEFLTNMLVGGPRESSELEGIAESRGIKSRTLWRAKKDLEIVAQKSSYSGAWFWSLPSSKELGSLGGN